MLWKRMCTTPTPPPLSYDGVAMPPEQLSNTQSASSAASRGDPESSGALEPHAALERTLRTLPTPSAGSSTSPVSSQEPSERGLP